MRKIVAELFVSLDGVVEAPETWVPPYAGDEFTETILTLMSESDALLVGRRTYEVFAASWPERGTEDPMAAYMNTVRKVVVSTTLERADWNNSTVLTSDVAEKLTELKQQPGKTIKVAGSPTLVAWLLRNQLLDELSLLIFPVVVGKGRRLFADDGATVPLRLVESRPFSTGILSAVYTPAPSEG